MKKLGVTTTTMYITVKYMAYVDTTIQILVAPHFDHKQNIYVVAKQCHWHDAPRHKQMRFTMVYVVNIPIYHN